MDFLLFGIQGSGKGTQGKILCEKFGFAYFETGGELRKLAGEKSSLAEKVAVILKQGTLVPTEIVLEIVKNFLKNTKGPVVFDGIPRNQKQTDALIKILESDNRKYMGILFLLSKEEAIQRLLNRRICSVCKKVYQAKEGQNFCDCGGELIKRSDDTKESIEMRFRVFEEETMSVVKKFEKEGKLITINSNRKIEEVSEELAQKIQLYINDTIH